MTVPGDVIAIDTATLIQREIPRDQERINHWRQVLRDEGSMPPIE